MSASSLPPSDPSPTSNRSLRGGHGSRGGGGGFGIPPRRGRNVGGRRGAVPPPGEIPVPRRGDRSPVRPPASPDGRGDRALLLRRRPALRGGLPPRMEGGPLRPEMIP